MYKLLQKSSFPWKILGSAIFGLDLTVIAVSKIVYANLI